MLRLVRSCLTAAVLAGCASVDPSAPDPLTVTANTALAGGGDSVVVTSRVYNTSGHSVEFNISPCVAGFSAYSNSDRRGTPVWEFAPWKGVCPAILVTRLILPAGTHEVRVVAAMPAGLPAGRFYFNSIIQTIPPDGATVPAGQLDL